MMPVNCAKGTVTLITLKNFTTYACTRIIRPSPGLNLVCGPNGSGKSSLVSAIVLGLGFKHTTIADNKKLQDYISKGCNDCEIEIELSDGGFNRSQFTRRFFLQDQKEVFLVKRKGGAVQKYTSRATYNAFIRDTYAIRLDNVTQYLPQSKQQEFQKLSPKDRLNRLLEAVKPELLEQRRQIEARDEDKSKKEDALKTSQTLAEDAEKALERNRRERDKIKEQLDSNDTLRLLELGTLAKEHSQATAAAKEQKEQNKEIKENYKRAKEAADAAEALVSKAAEGIKRDTAAHANTKKHVADVTRTMQESSKKSHAALQVRAAHRV